MCGMNTLTAPRRPGRTPTTLAERFAIGQFSPSVTAGYLRSLAWWRAWSGAACEMDTALVARFLAALATLGATKAQLISALGALRLFNPSVAGPVQPPRSSHLAGPPLRRGEIERLGAQAIHPGTKLAVELMAAAGLRETELWKLSPNDFWWPQQGLVLAAGPNAPERWIPFPTRSLPEIARALQRVSTGDVLWQTVEGAPLTHTMLRTDLQQAARKAGLPSFASPAALRRAFGASELESGRDLRLILARLALPDASGSVPNLRLTAVPPAQSSAVGCPDVRVESRRKSCPNAGAPPP